MSPLQKEMMIKVLNSFKSGGATLKNDIPIVPKMIIDNKNVAHFDIKMGPEVESIEVNFDTGDVFFEDFTSKKSLGNVSDVHKLTDTIKKEFSQEKDIEANMDEESATGGGASFSAGTGEQYATPIAFKKNPKIVRYPLKEEDGVSYTPEKAQEILDKYKRDLPGYQSKAERLYNTFTGFSIGDLLEDGGEDKIDRIREAAEKMYSLLSDIWDKVVNLADDFSENDLQKEYDEAHEVSSGYHKLYEHVYEISDFCHKVYMISADMKEHKLDNLTKYKK